MYRVLIADDEEIIRRGIAKLLEKDNEIEVVAQAEDGEYALELAKKYQPELLFVDINMPFLNGLEFIEKIHEELAESLIVIITGYDDFKYAQRALQLGVFEYQLKPISEERFYDTLNRAKQRLSSSHKQQRYLDWARMQLEKNKANLTAEFLDKWFEGLYSETEIEERISYLGMELPDKFGVSIVHFLSNDIYAETGQKWDEELLFYAVENIAREVYEPLAPISSCKNSSGDLILISASIPVEQWNLVEERLKMLLLQYLNLEVSLVRCVGENYLTLPEVYEHALSEIERQSECPQIIREIKDYIEENYSDENFSLQDAANFAHVSPQHLSRVFRHEIGITFMDYVTRIRIRKAIELLRDADLKIYEIAQKVGYSSQHYFSSAFKRVLGVSPLEYRKNEQHR
ncbi:response regulator [Clostridiaceae bacterium NSJ-31]|uniref:Stage 0 sporulation protein A homolog n=2 Tax=Ligaoa zhengdingensis TaxID=2763658 RepID=A0A926E159_9FIRM|nr:response regulator [Ligaoa zhengdingensis]MBC8547169.1 response regulator [Ligaoa zhengdingensis]